MDILTLDWETYYAQDYSLSNMTTEAYVRDPRFEEILASVKINAAPAFWLLPDRLSQFLKEEIDWENTALICHHSHFDGLILSHHHGLKPAMHIDTLSMARILDGPKAGNSLHDLCIRHGIGAKGDYVTFAKGKRYADFTRDQINEYGKYCCNDADRTYDLARIFLDKMPLEELQIIDKVIRMFTEPVFFGDAEKLKGAVATERQRKIDVLRRIGLLCPICNGSAVDPQMAIYDPIAQPCKKCDGTGVDKKTIGSNEKLANLFRECGIEPETKTSNTTGEQIYAFAKTDPAMQALLEDEYEDVRFLAEARIAVKSNIIETRAERYQHCAERGPMPVYESYAAAHTFRMGGGDSMNWLNISSKHNENRPELSVIAASILAPPGYKIVTADSGQGEARITAWLAGQHDLVEAFAQGRDVYSEHASTIYGRKVDRKKVKADHVPGQLGKVSILGMGFGMGWLKASAELLKGMLGSDPIQFTQADMETLHVDPSRFLNSPGKVKQVAEMPSRLELNARLIHCATTNALIDRYRTRYPQITGAGLPPGVKGYWQLMEDVISAMIEGREMVFGAHGIMRTAKDKIWMPNGLPMRFDGIRRDEHGQASYYNGRETVKLFGAKLVENCLVSDTLILTPSGFKRIVDMSARDKVWDGMEWVSHDGVAAKGYRSVLDFGGIGITPEHEVIINGEWKYAEATTYEEAASSFERHYGHATRNACGSILRRQQRAEIALDVPMRLRQHMYSPHSSVLSWACKFMRVFNSTLHFRKSQNTRNVSPSSICSMALYDRSLSAAITSGVSQLWRPWHNGMQTLARAVRKFLGRYGADIPARAHFRSQEERQRILQTKLPVDYIHRASAEHARKSNNRYPSWGDAVMESRGNVRHREDNTTVSFFDGLAEGTNVPKTGQTLQEVYDIMNAGPRRRFTIRGTDGQLILVHNCVQCLHYIIVSRQLLEIAELLKVALTTYDDVVTVVPEEAAPEALKFMVQCMSKTPAWATGLPLIGEGKIGNTLKEAS